MIAQADFAALFRGHPVPEELSRLLAFQNDLGTQYTESLYLTLSETHGLVHGWSSEPAFLERLVAFAVANGSGSFYALWNPEDGSLPSQWPVVVFGDEGGEWVIASHVRDLLQLAALDVEPYVAHDRVFFYIDEDDDEEEDDEDSEFDEGIDAYRDWLKSTLGLKAVEDPAPVVDTAQARWQAAFDDWKRPFLEGAASDSDLGDGDDSGDDHDQAGATSEDARSESEDEPGTAATTPANDTRPDSPERRLLLDFMTNEAGALTRGEQGDFWPSHHHQITPLIGRAGKFLNEGEQTAFFYHLLRLDHAPSLKSEEDFRLLYRAYEALRSIVWRGYPVCMLPVHAALFLFGHDQFGRLPSEPTPSLALYRSSLEFLRYARSFSHMPGIMSKRDKFVELSADRALVARVRKTLVYDDVQTELGQLWLWAFVFLTLQVEDEAAAVVEHLRAQAAEAGDDKHLETLARFMKAAQLPS
ncbi:hypothetical protein OU995_08570 [Roseateles sp. SL47]|uniref:hypothetical protein n=1 Tax=Roseateles sp. SL47 TaxID=2995138 RepID=UPI00226E3CAA|nr:hypothetical protein [Roseateles sp. SL47]WAC74738.1 hypothetical protein OU995_08570 [Roseateles sp. SL47]